MNHTSDFFNITGSCSSGKTTLSLLNTLLISEKAVCPFSFRLLHLRSWIRLGPSFSFLFHVWHWYTILCCFFALLNIRKHWGWRRIGLGGRRAWLGLKRHLQGLVPTLSLIQPFSLCGCRSLYVHFVKSNTSFLFVYFINYYGGSLKIF